MNKKLYIIASIWLLTSASAFSLGDVLERATKQIKTTSDSLFQGIIEEKQRALTELKEQRDKLQKELTESEPKIIVTLDEIRSHITTLQKDTVENEAHKQRITVLNEMYQTVKDLQRAQKQLMNTIDEYITLLTEFLKDPDFTTYLQETKQQTDRLYNSFEDMLKIYDALIDQEKKVELLTEEEKSTIAELESRKRSSTLAQEAFKKKRDELKEIARNVFPTTEKLSYTPNDALEILSLEEQLFNYRKELDTVRSLTSSYKLNIASLQLYIAKGRQTILKEYLRRIKSSVRVSENELAKAQELLTRKKQTYYGEKESLRQLTEQITTTQKAKEKEREELSRRFNIPISKEIDEWNKEPKKSAEWVLGFCEVAAVNTVVLLLQERQQLIDAQIALEDEGIIDATIKAQAKGTYHKITSDKFLSEDDITQEIKRYEAPKAEATASITRYREKMNVVADRLSSQKKSLDRLMQLKEFVTKHREIFNNRLRDYMRCTELINQSEAHIRQHIDLLGKLTGIYSSIVSTDTSIVRLIDFLNSELKAITIWHRPEYAISWRGISNLVPDMLNFLSDVQSYITRITFQRAADFFSFYFKHPLNAIILFVKLLGLLVLLILFKRLCVTALDYLLVQAFHQSPFLRFCSLIAAAMVSFFTIHFVYIAVWILTFLALRLQTITDPYVYILFYLCSIPYLLYLAYSFIRHIIHFNVRNDYVFLEPEFQRRFVIVISTLLYATIVIFFFREAFILGNYYRSELPTILHAVNFIIFQISLILLISKDMILTLIPIRTEVGIFLKKQVDDYYFLIQLSVITVIIMINPYVGFGKLVLYMLLGLIYTSVLIMGLLWLHGLLKKLFSRIFFVTNDDVIRDRFPNAKTWFGLLIIGTFIILVAVGCVIGAKIWGWRITFKEVFSLINEPILLQGTQNPITVWSLLMVVVFVLIGFLIAYMLNTFVLDKIFDLLLVDSGVQHTVTSIAQYAVVIIALFFGLRNVGLGELVGILIAALTLSLGWILREPISDFIAYFVILVQRPIKIGDFVQIDKETNGVVRRITARSVVLRRKNSVTIIIPNSTVINKTVVNWNYSHSFIAFNDITIYIDFSADPQRTKELLQMAVQSHPNVLRSPQPIIRLEGFAEYGYRFLVRGFLSSVYTLEQWDIESDVRLIIARLLREHNIKIAVRTVGMPPEEERVE